MYNVNWVKLTIPSEWNRRVIVGIDLTKLAIRHLRHRSITLAWNFDLTTTLNA